ncbi:UvrABC system protein A [Jeotgalicoccus aerolatus]|uniref:UvrABC system protein A n=1 Tax=Jeotgalicoccus aerolatus TaxID=709510 RepID=A0ABS4HJQ5_9STAP|nr:excinuclease ABC subunit UvrA [Jeotgalicoccus aerolatus]MBP1951159.1 excinuclease ABC subunit A [Jeotgalicoccus aerolatus]NMA81625.1 excinuclease ABC subunit UvrA [Jeotgalicoccus aerolatus]CAD2077819.1 UvrABC system protein A [Jeotgalicoccus aerolatus]GGD99797.1 UvrABC system protein A [Jeotgalicoccus aerolatus]HJG32407.1 excinuclease ABC subunit UvrA [Jeotgalicoccus aerolatus]
MKNPFISIRGARENNLKGINIDIPRDQLVVMTGLSGSGKSSLAFDTIYAEGQRRYVESLSSYARQFLGQMSKPDVDAIEGLSPAISIDQKTTSNNPRSTVSTITEIYDYLRLLYARAGTPYCPIHNIEISSQTIEEMTDIIMQQPERTRIQIFAPLMRGKKGEHKKLISDLSKEGYARVIVDGEMYDIEEAPELSKSKKHDIDVVIDRLAVREGIESRLSDSLQVALEKSGGNVTVNVIDGEDLHFSEHFSCPECGFTISELEPRLFSFNAPYGACTECDGLGMKMSVDENLVVPDQTLSLEDGAVVTWQPISSTYYNQLLTQAADYFNIDMTVPFKDLTKKEKNIIFNGSKDEITFKFTQDNGVVRERKMAFEGVLKNIERRYNESPSEYTRNVMSQYMRESVCKRCDGYRLNDEALAVKVNGTHIGQIVGRSVKDGIDFFDNISLSAQNEEIAEPILKEIDSRLSFLRNVGLDYLTLNRKSGTLSGGEAQRIRLATQIGSRLSGVLYILDEPSIGLHQRDNDRLISTLKEMRELGNTLIVVEHDEDTMLASDYLVDIGPGAGEHGGEVVSSGTPEEVMRDKNSITGQYLSGRREIPLPENYRKPDKKKVFKIKGARENNLKNIDVNIPLGILNVVTGVSGSGKSTLINEILYKSLHHQLYKTKEVPGAHDKVEGIEHIDKIIDIDQSPIGRTPRSNPATYTGVFDNVRDVFAQTNEAKVRGYSKGRFSFNVKGGRCEACKGDGILRIEMHFLPDVFVPCEVCHGKRYNRETLEVKYKDKNIADVLQMTVEEAYYFFENLPKIKRKIKTLVDVGLGYVRLGQPATTLSGGEAQRVKLASELHRRSNGKTLYILDEPTTGLHSEDIKNLIGVIQRLVDQNDTVVIIEHNLDVIKVADNIIDLGPEGGEGGGNILVSGTVEDVIANENSYTGQHLKKWLNRNH